METGLFERSGKSDPRVKWQKNIFRFMTVFFCAALSYIGAADLDKFVSFVGSFAWCVRVPVQSNDYHFYAQILAVYRYVTSTQQCCTIKLAPELASRRLQIYR